MSDELNRALGRIEGKMDLLLDKEKEQDKKLEGIDARLRTVETKSAVYGTVGGTLAGVGVSLIVGTLKSKLGIP
ncbi:MAG: hypothetical protein BWK73_13995 [Thiothrix lacustris]|uniref:Uncharacterized protein n=1 Tax=Thiothrix lacustris TaxID=525917 RepID=A0A1Y1QSX4_9GAMM|nr:MAG: hypothetical protein BWK73_13995 [Thiothrix lacustris]